MKRLFVWVASAAFLLCAGASATNQDSYRLLKITNYTKYILRMDVRVCIDQGTRCAGASVLPLGPGLSNYESWSEPIDVVLLSNFQLEEVQ